ncbi:hypothetical protein ACETK8_05035 [Brevundimonas staleyi]|uniref:Uncharacterized protein n=1 Tax=Brevundimonas staleyi TaxID=74326 RepID=A0ABW0FX14_9CAUL
MFPRALQACRRPRARFAVIVAVIVACCVANEQARAEPVSPVHIAAAPF